MAQTLLPKFTGTKAGLSYRRSVLAAVAIVPIILIFGHSVIVIGQPDSIYRLREGTRITLKLDAELNSRAANVNDTFLGVVTKPIADRDVIVVPAGALVEGRVTAVTHAGAAGRDGRLDVVFETLKLARESRRIDGLLVNSPSVHSSRGFGIWSVFGGAAAGAALGGVAGSASGALIGGAAGAGAGGALAALKRGKEVRFKRGEEIEIELRSPVVLPVEDY